LAAYRDRSPYCRFSRLPARISCRKSSTANPCSTGRPRVPTPCHDQISPDAGSSHRPRERPRGDSAPLCCASCNLDAVRCLLSHSARVNVVGVINGTPLDYLRDPSIEIDQLLREHGGIRKASCSGDHLLAQRTPRECDQAYDSSSPENRNADAESSADFSLSHTASRFPRRARFTGYGGGNGFRDDGAARSRLFDRVFRPQTKRPGSFRSGD
jgi:hypothetical protein